MKKIYYSTILLFAYFSLFAGELHYSIQAPLYEHMVAINKEWKTQEHQIDQLLKMDMSFQSDDDRIQMHLTLVEMVLSNRTTDLSPQINEHRQKNLRSLTKYYAEGQFPKNTYHDDRQPYFIDAFGTACAVGHLLQTSGQETLAKRISLEQNYAYIRELQYPELSNWAVENGFETNELAWIQPSYNPNAGYEECLLFDGYPLNSNPNNKVNSIKSINVMGSNLLYIGGDFQMTINGVTVNSIVAYNGYDYIDLGIDIVGEVKDIVEFNNSIIIVGDFQDQTSMASNIIQYTPGVGYTGLQTGAMNGAVDVAEVLDCVLYVGGDFTSINGANQAYLAAYTASAGWTTSYIIGCGVTMYPELVSVNGPVNALTIANNELAVGGEFTQNGSSTNNAAPNGLSFYGANGWTTPTLNPGLTLTSVDHLAYSPDSGNGLVIGGDNLMGYDFSTSSFVQGGCLGVIDIPSGTGRVDAILGTDNGSSNSMMFYRIGEKVNTLVGAWTLNGPVGAGMIYDAGGEINAIERHIVNGQYGGYYVGGQFSNMMLFNQPTVGGWCDSYGQNSASRDLTPNYGAIYKFIWYDGFPVEMTSFEGKLEGDEQVGLTWQTQSEQNSSHYEVERSLSGDENSFEKIGEVAAAENSTEVLNYSFTDHIRLRSNYLYYRLKIVDLDGTFDYTKVIVIKLSPSDLPDIELFPNPAADVIQLEASFSAEGATTIQVLNLQGKLVKEINYLADNGFVNTKIGVGDLAAGMYLLQIIQKETNNRLVTKFQKMEHN